MAQSGPSKPKEPAWDWGVPGLKEALTESLSPHVDAEPVWTPEQMEEKIGVKITKAAKAYKDDPRLEEKGSALVSRYIVEEFVGKAMSSISSGCWDKPWLYKVNFTGPLLAQVLHAFGDTPAFRRALAPAIEKFVEDAIFIWAEEERISKAITDTVEECNIDSKKKAVKKIQEAYDSAHFLSPFGMHKRVAPTTEMGMLMDFVKGWMIGFVGLAWDVIMAAGDGQEVQFLTMLFQTLTNPQRACLPHELTTMIRDPPAAPWLFINECAAEVWQSHGRPSKKSTVAPTTAPQRPRPPPPGPPSTPPRPDLNMQAHLLAAGVQLPAGYAGGAIPGLHGQFPGLHLPGLYGIPPQVAAPQLARPY